MWKTKKKQQQNKEFFFFFLHSRNNSNHPTDWWWCVSDRLKSYEQAEQLQSLLNAPEPVQFPPADISKRLRPGLKWLLMSNKRKSTQNIVIEVWCNKAWPQPSLLNNVSLQWAHPHHLPGNVRDEIRFQMSSKHESLKENAFQAQEYCFVSSVWIDKAVGLLEDWLDCIFSHIVAVRSASEQIKTSVLACVETLGYWILQAEEDGLPRGTSHTLIYTSCSRQTDD